MKNINYQQQKARFHSNGKFLLHVILIIVSMLVFSINVSAAVDKQNAINSIVAIVNDNVITLVELEEEIKAIKMQLAQQRVQMPSDEQLVKQVLERLILTRIQLELAQQRHLDVDDESLNNAISNVANGNGMDIMQFRRALESSGMPFVEYRERIRKEMIISRLQQRQVFRKINVTDQEIADFLANQELRDRTNEEYRLQHLLLVVPEAASGETIQKIKSRAEDIMSQLNSGADFAQMAIANSDGQQALEGGDLGWRKLAEIPSIFAEFITKMKVGELSNIVRSPSGFHIIKLAEKRDNEPQHIVTQTRARHILLQIDEVQTEEEVKTRILQLKQRIESGDDFATIATANSQDKGSAGSGGDLGWIDPGTMVKDFEDALNKLEVNQISDPVKTQFGWHLIKVEERRKYDNTEQFMKNTARQFIQEQKRGPALENWLRQIRDEAFVELRL
jgi:peptidyl-prolyl cis-trans isomerase SurA